MAIRGFKSKALKRFSETGNARKLPAASVKRIARILAAMRESDPLGSLRAPAYGLHPLKGDRKGVWSVTVTGNRRITFRYDGEHVYDIDLIDYH